MRRLVVWTVVVALVVGTGACNKALPTEPSQVSAVGTPATASVTVNPQTNELRATFANGRVVESWASYEQEAAQATLGQPFTINVFPTDGNVADAHPEADVRIQALGYQLRIAAEVGRFIGGCIKDYNVPHINIMVTKLGVSRPLFDGHLAAWRDSRTRQLCMAIYESTSRFCVSSCGTTATKIRAAIKDALVAAGISAVVAAVLADLTLPVAAGALAF
jgi:hypothetical protein